MSGGFQPKLNKGFFEVIVEEELLLLLLLLLLLITPSKVGNC